MLGFRYLKAPATTYVLEYKAGRVKREGPGLPSGTSPRHQSSLRCLQRPAGFDRCRIDGVDVLGLQYGLWHRKLARHTASRQRPDVDGLGFPGAPLGRARTVPQSTLRHLTVRRPRGGRNRTGFSVQLPFGRGN
jgi:hypothetical protein